MGTKKLIAQRNQLTKAGRWDIDFHLPALEIKKFQDKILTEVRKCADIVPDKRNPELEPDKPFLYVDISSIDVATGIIVNPQELIGEEAPSRARKVIRAGDIIISTCRPTRGAIAIVPSELDNQICSTGFSVIRVKKGVNIQYLHFVLRSESTREQFRKWSTGSSYPAILDEDVLKTIIPLPKKDLQDKLAEESFKNTELRNKKIAEANETWKNTTNAIFQKIIDNKAVEIE